MRQLHLVRHFNVTAREVTQYPPEPIPEFRVHPTVDEGIVHTVAHGEPVKWHPDVVHALGVVDGGVDVSGDVDDVQRKPAGGVDHHHHDHHTDDLQKEQNRQE